MQEIKINDLTVFVNSIEQEEVESQPTHNKLRQFSFKFDITGKEFEDKLEEALAEIFEFKIMPDGIEFKAEKNNYSWSFSEELNNNTIIHCDLSIIEHDKDLPEDWNVIVSIRDNIITNWVRTRALSEILIEKGLTTPKEYEDKILKINKRDYEEMYNMLVHGLFKKEEDAE